MTVILNTTGNPITREERIKINQNWDRIVQGLTRLQQQLNDIAGGEDLEKLLQDVKKATAEAITATSEAQIATSESKNATANAITATQSATAKIAEMQVLITQAQSRISEMDSLIAVAQPLILTMKQLQDELEPLKAELEAIRDEIKGWNGATEWLSNSTYERNNVVTYEGSTWQSKKDGNKNSIPSKANADWILLAERGGSTKLIAIPAKLETNSVDQKVWDLPDFYKPVSDTIMFYFNTVYLRPEQYTITGDEATGFKLNFDSPESAIVDNNIDSLIFKNVPTDDNGMISGIDLEDGSVTLSKLGQDVKDAIAAGGAGVEIEIVNDLTTGGTGKALSAEMGKELKRLIDNLPSGGSEVELVNDLTSGGVDKALSAEQGKVIKALIDQNKTDIGLVETKVNSHINNNNIHVTNWDKDRIEGSVQHGFTAAMNTENPDEFTSKTNKSVRTNHINVQNEGETNRSWLVTTYSAGLNSQLMQVAYRVSDGDIPIDADMKTRYTNLDGTEWSPWSPSSQQLFTSVSDGKALVASAITGKGVPTASDATFQQMADNISAISQSGSGSSKSHYVTNQKWQGEYQELYSLFKGTQLNHKVFKVTVPFFPNAVSVQGIGSTSGSGETIIYYSCNTVINIAGGSGRFLTSTNYHNQTAGTVTAVTDSFLINPIDNGDNTWTVVFPIIQDSIYDVQTYTFGLYSN